MDGAVTYDDSVIADAFSDYFLNHPLEVYNNILEPDVEEDNLINLLDQHPTSMYFAPSNSAEVSNILNSLKKQGEFKDVPLSFLRLCDPYISDALSNLLNSTCRDSTPCSPWKAIPYP